MKDSRHINKLKFIIADKKAGKNDESLLPALNFISENSIYSLMLNS